MAGGQPSILLHAQGRGESERALLLVPLWLNKQAEVRHDKADQANAGLKAKHL